MPPRTITVLALLALLAACATGAAAQWPDDPATNLAIADRPGEQVVPKLASTSDGGIYVGWFDQASGNYDVYLQRLDAAGVEQWPHNGILISDHPQNSWLVDWDLTTDPGGNAILAFSDARDGSDLDIQAYKISPAGDFLWGADGVTLSANNDFEPAPRVAISTVTGDAVFVWSRLPDTGDGAIVMQRLSPAGVELLAPGGVTIVSQPGAAPALAAIAPGTVSPGGPAAARPGGAAPGTNARLTAGVYVSWVRDITNFMTPRHVRAQLFATDGTPVWASHAEVFDLVSVPIAYTPRIQSDLAGGAILLWHASEPNNTFYARVQRLNDSGVEAFAHNGVAVSTVASRHHLDPTLAWRAATGDLFVFWNERNLNQSQWGIYGQRLVAGVRQWGDEGVTLLPVDTIYKLEPHCAPYVSDSPMLFLIDEPTGTFGHDRVIGMQVDDGGNLTWPGGTIEVASLSSGKSRLTVTGGTLPRLIWEDDRNGTVDVFGQNVNPDGSLGPWTPTGTVDAGAPPAAHLRLAQNRPNPFTRTTEIEFDLDVPAGGARIVIFDASGRTVRRLDVRPAGGRAGRVFWDGRDQRGQPLAAGVYFYRLATDAAGTSPTRKALLVR